LWRSAFKDLKIPSAGESGVGNGKDLGGDEDEPFDRELQSALPEETFVKFGASLIIDVLQRIEDDKVIVVDEFDSLNWKIFDIRLMADTIKQISDSVSDTTIVIVGVATDISELISQQVSIGRNLIHKHVPQMGFDATSEIVSNGLGVLGMTMDTAVQRLIAKFSCGYPYFTHLLSFHACRNAVLRGSKEVVHNPDFISALSRSIEEAEYWLRKAYQDATYDSTKSSYEKVLWACALARIDDVDRPFGPEDIRIHLGRLLLKTVAANTASRYLSALCKGDRGSVLEKCVDGGFRFKDPRLVAFCMMKYEEKRQKSLAKPDDGGGLYPDRDFESEQRH
jgi:hypothetical protein